VAVISAVGAGMNVVGNLVLIPLWGINGAAGATALSTVAVSLAFAVLAYRALGIRSFLLSWR
jgi:O-antigen/teichoic acid export membrane protein